MDQLSAKYSTVRSLDCEVWGWCSVLIQIETTDVETRSIAASWPTNKVQLPLKLLSRFFFFLRFDKTNFNKSMFQSLDFQPCFI